MHQSAVRRPGQRTGTITLPALRIDYAAFGGSFRHDLQVAPAFGLYRLPDRNPNIDMLAPNVKIYFDPTDREYPRRDGARIAIFVLHRRLCFALSFPTLQTDVVPVRRPAATAETGKRRKS